MYVPILRYICSGTICSSQRTEEKLIVERPNERKRAAIALPERKEGKSGHFANTQVTYFSSDTAVVCIHQSFFDRERNRER